MDKQKMRGFRIKDCIYNEFKEVCDKNDAIPSKVIRRCIIDYIKKNK